MENLEGLDTIRKSLLDQIEKTFPEETKEESKQQLLAMNDEEFIYFLKQNGMLGGSEEGEEASEQKCIFCSIASGEIPSTQIMANDRAVAILDINPVSEGHILIIPREHLANQKLISKEIRDLANKIAEKLQKVFSPTKVEIEESEALGHSMLNVFPVYENETLTSSRKRKSPSELAELRDKINSAQEEIKEEPKKAEEIKQEDNSIPQFNEKNFWLPKRRP